MLVFLGCVFFYSIIGSFALGICAARSASKYNEEHTHRFNTQRTAREYWDDIDSWLAGLFWPGYIVLLVMKKFSRLHKYFVELGSKAVEAPLERKRLRIRLEQKIRIEQERIEEEAMAEVETELRKDRAA